RDHDELSAELYGAIAPASRGGVWLAGKRGELERLDRDGTVLPADPAVREALDGLVVWSLREDRDGDLWVGQRRTLVQILQGGGSRHWGQDGSADATLAGPLTLMDLAPDGTLWMSFTGAGMQQRDPATGRVLLNVPAGPAHGLGVGDNEALGFDADGVPWVAGGA